MNERLIAIPSMTIEQAKKIVVAYGAVLGNASTIVDENDLPFAKAVIKQAILMMAAFAPSSEARRALRLAYLALADFLPGVGSQKIHRLRRDEKRPETAEETAAFVADFERKLRWLNLSATETQQLLRELRDSGLLES